MATRGLGNGLLRLLSSLKVRLALTGAWVIALAVTATAWLVLGSAERRVEQTIRDTHLGAEATAQQLSGRVLTLQAAMVGAAAQWPADTEPDLAASSAYLASQSVLAGLFTRLLVATPTREPAYFSVVRHTDRLAVSGPVRNPATGSAEVLLSAPLPLAAGHPPALLCGTLALQGANLLGDAARPPAVAGADDIETIVTDAEGTILAHPDPAWLLRDVRDEPRLAAAAQRWHAQGRPLEPTPWTQRDNGRFVAMMAVPVAEWMVFRSASAAQLLGQPAASRREALLLALVVALGGALVISGATAFMLRPLGRLEQRARRLLDGDLGVGEQWPRARGEIGHLSDVIQHVLQQREASQQDNTALLTRLQAVMSHAPVGIAFTRERHFELVSAQFAALFHTTGEALTGQPHSRLYSSQSIYDALVQRATGVLDAGLTYDEELEFTREDGSRFWGYLRAAAVRPGEPGAGTIWTLVDVSEFHAQRVRLSWTATHDPLTELVNRREFDAQLERQLRERRRGEPASLLFIDLDGFKAVNDSAGHAAGDAILRDVAGILKGRVRENDTVARLGGDEFALLLRRCDQARALGIAEQIRQKVAEHRRDWEGHRVGVATSIGVVQIDERFRDVAAVVAAADAACYAAKRAGRNQVRTDADVEAAGNPADA